MGTDKTDSDSGGKASRTSTYLRTLKIPATFLLVALALLAGYYSLYVRNSLEYLKGRDLRLLSTVGAQIQASIEDHEKVLSSFSNYYGPRVFAEQFGCKEIAPRSIEMFAYVSPDLPGGSGKVGSECGSVPAVQTARQGAAPTPAVRARFIDDSRTAWMHNRGPDGPPADDVVFRVDLNSLLAPLLAHQVGDDVFDALMLVAPSGRVIYSEGTPDLQLTSLDGILRRLPDGTWKEQPFAGTGHASQVLDVQISGGKYALYLQPCCKNLSDTPHIEKEPGWIVAGLTESGKLRSTSMAVSFSVMAFLGGLVLLAVFSWPFLKLTLMGQEHRLRVIDVLAVGICSLLGIALVMLFLVDWYSYGRLKEDLDKQLEVLSLEIQHNVGDEISHAYDQIRYLDKWTMAPGPDRVARLFSQDGMVKREQAPYPFFESFALIDDDGMQRRKWAVADFTTPFVPTRSREYFLHWRHWLDRGAPRLWEVPAGDDAGRAENAYAHTFLESIRSATTGRKEAVLSMPTDQHPGMPVATLTIPMLSLNDVALPPGFNFAIIDGRGRVMFHSDPGHGLGEQFFLEADSSRRLRSAIAARRDETLNIRYFGQDHRAHVAPLASLNGSSWSVVTLFDRQLLRTVNIEWLVTTMLFTVIYASLYIAICVIVLLFRPTYRAPWIWPDPAKRQDYQRLTVVYCVFAVAFVMAVHGLRGRQLLTFAWILPFIVWMATYVTLSNNRHLPAWRRWLVPAAALGVSVLLFTVLTTAGPVGVEVGLLVIAGVLITRIRVGPRVPQPYMTAAMLLLALTGVMPTAAFFQVAHAIQVDSYVKYGQLTLAREVQHRLEQSAKAATTEDQPRVLQRRLSRYGTFFYNTQVVDASEGAQAIARVCGDEATRPDAVQQDPRYELPKMLEDFLPYYSESSVGMRELLHDHSSDRAWDWHRAGSTIVLHTPPNAGWNTACVRSDLPAFSQAGIVSFDSAGKGAQVATLSAIAVFAIFWIVRFTTRRVFLIDVIEPLWARRAAAIPVHPGEHLYLVWRPADRKDRKLVEDNMYVVDLDKVTEPSREWFAAERDRLEQLPTGQTVVIDHLETRIGDAPFTEYKFALVRDALDVQHRTVVIVSALRPTSFVARVAEGGAPGAEAVERRWTSLLARFTVLEGIRFEGPAVSTATVTEVAATATTTAPPAPPSTSEADSSGEDGDPVVRSLWKEVSRRPPDDDVGMSLDLEQIHEEVGDRLDNYHRGIWESCSDAQKRVLKDLGSEGLVNEKNRRTVRLLLARGIIRKDPNFRFVSESFRRFVLFRIPAADVAAIEQRSSSAWDTVRLPFLITLLAVSAFFFLTQRELFTTTIAVITALAGGIPALVRVAGLFERQPERSGGG